MPTSTKKRLSKSRQAKLLAETQRFADLSTVRKPKKAKHEANFDLFDARKTLVASSKLPWTHKEVGHLLFARHLVERGQFSDWDDRKQSEGRVSLNNLGDYLA